MQRYFREVKQLSRPDNITTNLIPIKFFAMVLLLAVFASPAAAFDFSGWDGLLKKYVKPTKLMGVALNGVDYPGMAKDPAYKELVRGLEKFSPASLKSREDKLVFWINVYNVMAVKMIIDHYPLDSIKDAGSLFTSVWKTDVGKIGGKVVTLNEIEHKILRKMGEPRIHVAIVCASVSCPDLRAEAYNVAQLDAQLDDQMRQFLANPGKGMRLDIKKEKLYLSSIFDWFEEDFESKGGVGKFTFSYAPKSVQQEISRHSNPKKYKTDYLDYNWDLNKL